MATNEQIVYDFLLSKFNNPYAAAGVAGNIQAESNFNSINLQNTYEKSLNFTDASYTAAVDSNTYKNFVSDKAGYGLVQFTYWSRKEALLKYAKECKVSIGNLDMQLNFIWKELNSNYKKLVEFLTTAKSVKDASDAFMLQYEKPADQSAAAQTKRASYGLAIYKKYNPGKEETKPVSNNDSPIKGSYQYVYTPATKGIYWNLPTIKINTLILHSVGCPQDDPQVFMNTFNRSDARASVQGWISPNRFDCTAPIYEKQGYAKKCYHCGSGKNGSYNDSAIGIEMVEPDTIKYISGSTIQDLNPTASKKLMRDIVNTAIQVFGDLCIFHNIPSTRIFSHKEANAQGKASAHGDPEHVIKPLLNYTMNDFRSDVQQYIENMKGDYTTKMTQSEFDTILNAKFTALSSQIAANAPKIYKKISDVPAWGKATIEKLISKKLLAGTTKDEINISDDMLRTFIINDRAGLYDIGDDK